MKKLKKIFLVACFCAVAMVIPVVIFAEGEEATDQNSDGTSAADIGASSAGAINGATVEASEDATITGALIEIGNTTAEETTVIIRIASGTETEDVTLEVSNTDTDLLTNGGGEADLSDWIAGDQITFNALKFKNSGRLVAEKIKNRSFKTGQKGINGWIKAIRSAENEIDVEWGKNIYTLNLDEAKMVVGGKNPAAAGDFKVGDRVRCRVAGDNDGDQNTWAAKIVVVLRRGNDLFMRVTRWVVPAKIVSMPTDLSLPVVIEAEVLPSKFYQAGDVNNLIGAPETKIYIDISTSTKLVRHFLGKALLSEYSVGDNIMIIGRRDEATGHLSAQVVRNDSIQVLGVAQRVGKVSAVDLAARTITVSVLPAKRGEESITVNVASSTKIFIDGREMTLADVQVGDIIKAKGVYNRNTRAVDAKVIGITSVDRIESIKEKAASLRDKLKDKLKFLNK